MADNIKRTPAEQRYMMVRRLQMRMRRLANFLEWELDDHHVHAPAIIIGTEIDMVREALVPVEAQFVPDHEEYRADRAAFKAEQKRLINEMGEEAYYRSLELEFKEPEGSA